MFPVLAWPAQGQGPGPHGVYFRAVSLQEFLSSALDVLTPGDVRTLVQAEDELTRRGEFERVFPSPVSSRYMRFFHRPRYLNVLLCQWEQRCRGDGDRGECVSESV